MKRDFVSRNAAKAAGLLYYFSASLCKKGHFARRRTSTGVCTACEIGYIANYKRSPKYKVTRQAISKRQRLTVRGRGRAYQLVLNAKNRAEKYGLEFNLETWSIELRLQFMTCEVSGLPLNLEQVNSTNYNPWVPSLDRKDSSKGYTIDNVRLVCVAYNVAKGERSEDVLMTLVNALANK